MRDLRILEATHDMHERIAFPNVAEELIAQTLSPTGPTDQTGDIDKSHLRRRYGLRLEHLSEFSQPAVGDVDDANIRVDRAEGVCRRLDRCLRQCVKESRFPDIGKPDDAYGKSH